MDAWEPILERLERVTLEEERRDALSDLRETIGRLLRTESDGQDSLRTAAAVNILASGAADTVRVACTVLADGAQHGQAPAFLLCPSLLCAVAGAIESHSRRTRASGDDLATARCLNAALRLLQSLLHIEDAASCSNVQVSEVVGSLLSATRFAAQAKATARSSSRAFAMANTTAVGSEAAEREKRTDEVKRSVRMRVMACIRAWSSTKPRALFAHLSTLIADSPSSDSILLPLMEDDPALSVRIEAAACIAALLRVMSQGGYLQVADERLSSAAFTSLSGRVAALLVTVRVSTAKCILDAVETSPKFLISLLLIAEVFVDKIGDTKLQRKHEEVLGPALASASQHGDAGISRKASELISALRARKGGVLSRQRKPRPSAADAESICADVVATSSASRQAEGWTAALALCSSDGAASAAVKRALFAALSPALASADSEVCRAAATFLAGAIASWQLPADMLAIAGCHSETLVRMPDHALRRTAASIAAHAISKGCASDKAVNALVAACRDWAEGVAAAALHSIGDASAKCESDDALAAFAKVLSEALDTVTALPKGSPAKVNGTWALANLVDRAFASQDKALIDVAQWLSAATAMLDDVDAVHTNSARAIGGLFALAGGAQKASCLAALRHMLESTLRPPKAEWNHARALQRLFENTVVMAALPAELAEQAADFLAERLASSNLKVLDASAGALLQLLRGGTVSSETVDRIHTLAAEARKKAAAQARAGTHSIANLEMLA